jgi:hypothetical protein
LSLSRELTTAIIRVISHSIVFIVRVNWAITMAFLLGITTTILVVSETVATRGRRAATRRGGRAKVRSRRTTRALGITHLTLARRRWWCPAWGLDICAPGGPDVRAIGSATGFDVDGVAVRTPLHIEAVSISGLIVAGSIISISAVTHLGGSFWL